ncbi:MAG: hypothetical protein WBB19_05710 [Desulforhopalus sp.]
MTTISEYFEQALLSEAAYAEGLEKNWIGGGVVGNPSQYARALIEKSMSETQAIAFANKYKVVDQYTDPESGFSGTVFQDTSGKIFMAIRGTEGLTALGDWSTNFGDIGADGIAIEQGIAMYNWYQRLITSVVVDGTAVAVTQYEYHKETTVWLGQGQGEEILTPAYLEEKSVEVTKSGGLVNGAGVFDFAVTGHSLGGHLAMIMSRIAPDSATSTLTYNAPGFDANLNTFALTSDGFFDLLRDVEGDSSRIGSEWNDGGVINTYIEGDVVSQVGDLPGAGGQQLFSENINAGWYAAHKIEAITDALAVYNLLAQFDTNLTLDSITGILKASSNVGEYSLESTVSSLGGLFVSGFTKRTASKYNADRDQLYQDIKDITATISNLPNQTIKSFCAIDAEGKYIPLSASEINTLGQSNIAYRYALTNLNPFAVIGANYK